MIHSLIYAVVLALASGLVWRLALTGLGRSVGIGLAGVVLVLGGLVATALALGVGAPGWPTQVLGLLYAPLTELSGRLLPDLDPLLGAQLAVLVGYALVRLGLVVLLWVGSALRGTWRRLRHRRRETAPDPAPGAPGADAGLLSAWRMVVGLTGLVLAALPFFSAGGGLPQGSFDALVWVGAWLLLIELVARAESIGASDLTDIGGDDARALSEQALGQLYRLYIGRHREMLFACRRREAAPSRPDAVPAPVLRAGGTREGGAAALLESRWGRRLSPNLLQRLMHFAGKVDDGGDLLIAESLCSHHFVLVDALAQDCVDRGRSVLVLCPESSVEEIRDSLVLHAEPNLHRLTSDWVTLGRDDLAADADPDLVFCPDSELERALPLGGKQAGRSWRRLGLILCLEVQAMNVPLARFALARLRQLAEPSHAVRLVMQAARYEGVETLARSLHAPVGLAEERVSAWLETTRYLLIWNRDHEPLDGQRALYFPGLQERIAPELLLLLPAWERGVAVTRFDIGNRHDEDAFERLRAHLPVYMQERQQEILAAAAAHRPIGHGCIGAGAAVSLLDDPGNLLVALDHDGGSIDLRAALIHVLCGNYLLRDYFRALFAVSAPEDLPRALRPIAADPRGNLYTLAYALSRAFAAGAILSAAEIRDQFLDPSPANILRVLEIRPSRLGLQRLFDLAFGRGGAEIAVQPGEGGENAYRLAMNRTLPRAAYLTAVNEQGDPLGRLLASDHGVTYAVGQTLLFAHKRHRVVSVGEDRIELRHVDAAANQARERDLFDRRYRLPDEGSQAVAKPGETHRRELGDGLAMALSFELRTLEREALGYLTLPEDMRPFARAGASYSYTACDRPIMQTYRFQPVTRLRIDGIFAARGEPEDEGDDRRARLAFTLCALLQDAMTSAFPDQQARIAVVSPQARPPISGLDAGRPEDAGASDRAPIPADRHGHGPRRFPRQLYPSLEGVIEDADRGIDILVLEDSAFDLGVARALGEWTKLEHLLALVRGYLRWAADRPPETLYQAFGGTGLIPGLDYPAALDLLDRLLPSEPPPRAGALDSGCAESGETAIRDAAECDFCAAKLHTSFDRLDDGRCRCPSCRAQAVDTKAEFRRVFRTVVEHMEGDYGIRLRRDLKVRFVNANRIAAAAGSAFVPTSAMDPRTVGLAIRRADGSAEILLENGAPRLSTAATLAHELTHLWQFERQPELDRVPIETVEGQARFVEVDYLERHGGRTLAESIRRESRVGSDHYSRGFRAVETSCGGAGERLFDCFARQLGAPPA